MTSCGEPNTGWVLCDCYFPNGKPVPFSTRQLYRDALGQLSDAGKGCLVISSELPELLGICDRIYTLSEGVITGALLSSKTAKP